MKLGLDHSIWVRSGIISIFFINQKNFPEGPFLGSEDKYFTVGIDREVDNLFLGNIAVLHGPGLIVLILMLKFLISLAAVFAKVLRADLDELYEKKDSAQLTDPPEETLIIRP